MRRFGGDGFILIAVLSVMALFAAMIGAVSMLVRSNVEAARLDHDGLIVDALIRAGVELAGYQLFALRLPAESVDTRQIRLDAGVVTLSVAAEGGKIDLNAANPELLAGAYRSARLRGLSPQAFAGRVVDWRDADDSRSEQGAEAADYSAAGLSYPPQNGAFRTIDDLQWLPGVSAADVAALTPLVTVHNPAGALALYDAPRGVLLALPGVAEPTVDRILALRQRRNESTQSEIMRILSEQQNFVTAEAGPSYSVGIEIRRRDGFVKRVGAVLTASASEDALFYVVDWVE